MPIRALHGQTALVTGAAKRIGRAVCLALADEGANLVLHYNTSAAEALALAREVEQRGVRVWPVQADFAAPSQYESLLSRVLAEAGALDILINSASIFPAETLQELTLASLVRNVEVNAWAPFVLGRDFARLVGRGRIVNMLDSHLGGYDWKHVGYILSKHAFAVLTEMMAIEFAPDITVNGIAPGLILPPPGQPESYIDELAHTVPLRRHGSPEDVAQAVLYLLQSDFVTGQVINVDGGRHLREYSADEARPAEPPRPIAATHVPSLAKPCPPGDRILICDLLARCIIGVGEEERREKQDVVINITLEADLRPAGASDRFEEAIDYRAVKKRVLSLVEASAFHLIEALAEAIAATCLDDTQVSRVTVRVDKPGALRFARSVAVEVTRERQA
ncbi:MAG: SDR family oxidoreductase [Anaerolineae bacterium]